MTISRSVSVLRRTALLMCLVGSILVGAAPTAAEEEACNCTTEGQCASAACCFVNNDCMATNKTCVVMGTAPNKTCSAGAGCSYSGPCCAPPGQPCDD